MAGAQITVEGTRLGNVTNADGYYFILNVPPGLQSVTFTFTGYQKTTIENQRLLAGHTMTLDATLSSTVVELAGVTIQGEAQPILPRDQVVTTQRISAEKLEEAPATRLEDLMILEAGVQIGGSGGEDRGFRIRGGRIGEELMVVDGVMVKNFTANPTRDGVYWMWTQENASRGEDTTPLEFSTASVEEVDIITGGYQAEYGNAQSGIINIVTKEGGSTLKGRARITSDALMPETADWGYNQLQADVGGPVPFIPNLFYNVNGEIQGIMDTNPTRAGEGFRGVNQDFVDHLNFGVRNDPILGDPAIQPAFTLEELRIAKEAWVEKMGQEYFTARPWEQQGLWMPYTPTRIPDNWQDRHLVSSKVTYSPIKGLKLLATENFTRYQRQWPAEGDAYFRRGWITPYMLTVRDWREDRGDIFLPTYDDAGNVTRVDTFGYHATGLGRRTRTANYLTGADWNIYQTAGRSMALQFRYTNFRTQDVNMADLKDNYFHEGWEDFDLAAYGFPVNGTFLGWTPHDIPFMAETFPNRDVPSTPEDAKYYWPDGASNWNRDHEYALPFGYVDNSQLYYSSYYYTREQQHNVKFDFDMQINRENRTKFGGQGTYFHTNKFDVRLNPRVLDNEFRYRPRMFSLYVQNRTDLGDFVLDYGLRYDGYQPRDNWAYQNGDYAGERFFPENFHEFSPRFDVGFPVTDKAQMRFSYGVYHQLPGLTQLFSGSNIGGLNYSRTDAFESGISYMLTSDMLLDLVAYYRDADGNVASSSYYVDYVQWQTGRHIVGNSGGYSNSGRSNIKGLDLTLKKRFSKNYSLDLSYTMQFARTSAADVGNSAGSALSNSPGDRAHAMSAFFTYVFPDDFQAGNMANLILRNLRLYTIGRLESGSASGSSRGRWSYNLDLRANKYFYLTGTFRLSAFAEIYNLNNQKPDFRYPSGYRYQTYYTLRGGQDLKWEDTSGLQPYWFLGDMDGDGILTVMENVKGQIAQSMVSSLCNWSSYGRPRQVRMGLELNF